MRDGVVAAEAPDPGVAHSLRQMSVAAGSHPDPNDPGLLSAAEASLLVEQLTAPVKFTHAARELVGHGVETFVEVGPGNVLSGLLKRIDSSVRAIPVHDVRSLNAAVHELG